MSQKLLTIIIPVYKVEAYINKCLDSLLLDDSSDMEMMDILIINDGTPDRSAEISKEYVNRYPKYFRQIDKENGGHGSVWNLGVKEAYGKYVKFLDSDDWLENLDSMLHKLQNTDADLIITSNICHCPNNELWKLGIKDMEFDKVYDADKFDWLGNKSHRNFIFHHCAIYKTDMLRQYLPLFLEKQPYDDVILGAAPIIGSRTLVAWNLEVYHYLMDRPGQSISSNVMSKNLDASIKTQKHTIEFIVKHPIADKNSTKYQYFAIKLPKMCNYGYKSFLNFPYKTSKQMVKEWDKWILSICPEINSLQIKLYRNTPYILYFTVLRIFSKLRK